MHISDVALRLQVPTWLLPVGFCAKVDVLSEIEQFLLKQANGDNSYLAVMPY